MKDFTSFKYFYAKNSKVLNIVLHGASVGIETPFMKKVFTALSDRNESTIMFNFPYYERKGVMSSGSRLEEELEMLAAFMDYAESEKYKHIRLVGKSLGGIVASYFLREVPKEDHKKYSVVVLGYIIGGTKLTGFDGKVTIIQGEKDKYGSVENIKKYLATAKSKDINYYEIKGADHSYRNDRKEPEFEDEVIKVLFSFE